MFGIHQSFDTFPNMALETLKDAANPKKNMKFRGLSGHMASEIATSSTLWLCQNSY